ncbi:hypothetical protein Tco_1392783 [Tanacetum coccineum]
MISKSLILEHFLKADNISESLIAQGSMLYSAGTIQEQYLDTVSNGYKYLSFTRIQATLTALSTAFTYTNLLEPKDSSSRSSRDLSRGSSRDDIGDTPAGVSESILGPTISKVLEDMIGTPLAGVTPSAREQIEGHLSVLRSLVKEHISRGNVSLIHLSFDDGEGRTRVRTVITGKEVVDADLKRPFKEVVKTPLTRSIIEFAGSEFKMSSNIKLYDETTDPEDHLSRFSSAANSGEWPMPHDGWVELRQQFTTRFSTRRACFKDPTEITKIVRKANETLVTFKERWIMETGFIAGVPEVMKISSFMDAHKCPELGKRYSDKVPKTVDEMMTRLDDFVRSKEAFASTELPKGEASEVSKRSTGSINRREDRFHKGGYGVDRRRNKGRNMFNNRDGLVAYRPQAPYQAPKADHQGYHNTGVNLNSLTKQPKEILALELQLNLQPPRPMQLPPKKENQDRYYEYHREKGHYTNDCVRQRGRWNTKGRDAGKDKVINMIRSWSDDRKRKLEQREESWMKAPIVFPIVYGRCLRRSTHHRGHHGRVSGTLSVRRSGRVGGGGMVKPLGKIKLEVVFGDRGLFRRVMINFTVVRAPSPYNVILGRTGLRTLRAVSLTIHSMVKFPTPRGIATLVNRTMIISECRRIEKKQMIKTETSRGIPPKGGPHMRVDLTEQILVNPTYPNQLVTIGGNLSEGCKNQLKALLKKSTNVFAWEPTDMTCIPRRIIEHALNLNPSIEPIAQKRRVLAFDRTQVVIKEVEEWVKAGIVRPVKYPTWISNSVLVKKLDESWRMCIAFKNLNSTCLKDYYSLPDIDGKIESVVGFRYKCFLDAYKGYHQVQMAQDDEEKTAFYTDQGTYCYTKMPFGLKNARATYQRLVDTTFNPKSKGT